MQEHGAEQTHTEMKDGIDLDDAISLADADGHVDLVSDDEDGPDMVEAEDLGCLGQAAQEASVPQVLPTLDETREELLAIIEAAERKLEAKKMLLEFVIVILFALPFELRLF